MFAEDEVFCQCMVIGAVVAKDQSTAQRATATTLVLPSSYIFPLEKVRLGGLFLKVQIKILPH